MTEPQSSWAFVGISPEARRAAEAAAEAAGMELDTWLAQLIKYKSTMELKGREAVPLDAAIMQIAAPGDTPVGPEPETTAPEMDPAPVDAPPASPTALEARPEPDLPVDDETAGVQTDDNPASAHAPNLGASLPEAEPLEPPVTEAATVVEPETGAGAEAVEPGAPDTEPDPDDFEDPDPGVDTARETEAEAGDPAPGPVEADNPGDGPETVVLPAFLPSAGAKAPPRSDRPRPRADNDTGPLPDEPSAEADAPAASADGADPSPRKTLPTEAMRPSRLSALNQATEDAIQGAFDAWRDSRTVEPLLVRPSPDERNVFEVIVGVERWHAARRAHIRELPVRVHEATDEDAIRLAMSARLKRGPLSPLAEAGVYLSLMSEAGMSSEQVARMVGKPPAHVATMVRVLSLPRGVRDMLERGELTALHARALLDAPNAEALAREVIARRLDIYQTEQLVRSATLKAERAEKVDLAAVDLDLGEGETPAAAAEPAVLDGETGFGPEERLDRESFAPAAEPDGQAGEAEADDDTAFVFDDVSDESLDLIDAPEIEEEAVAFGGSGTASPGFPASPGADLTKPDATPPSPPAASLSPPAEATGGDSPSAGRPAVTDGGKDTEPATGKKTGAAKAPAVTEPKKGVVTTELLEHHLSHLLGLKVAISESHNMGVISIHYTDREELSDVVARLNSGSPR